MGRAVRGREMAKKKRVKKGIESLEEQIEQHGRKLAEASERGDVGSERYLRREMERFSKEKDKRMLRSLPRKERIKLKKKR